MSENDSVQGKLVALLGCAGSARKRLREVLIQAGVDLVLEEDPRVLDIRILLGVTPEVVVIALEPVIEEALETLDVVLQQPGLTVIFDEAELIARRQGWEAQRWSRHLLAKLQGQDNALPQAINVEANPAMDLAPNLENLHVDDSAEISLEIPTDDAELASNTEQLMTSFSTKEPVLAPLPAAPLAPLGSWTLGWQLVDEVIVDQTRSETFSLAQSCVPPPSFGAVLVLAGIGGPDAIRRLLAALPAGFKHPVLIKMDGLDGGQYINLVRQMGRVSTLPVDLAESGHRIQDGRIYVLRDNLGISLSNDVFVFCMSSENSTALLVEKLSPTNSAVLLLSGASPTVVPDILAFANLGGWVAGQASAGCYDPTAASLIELDGQFSGNPTQLAHALSARWPTKH
ncbi:glutamate methyltransferase [Xylella fastidiosa subsp. fastidiosa]|uniref:CheB-type methylesterase domain-containing protein n=2 Tax=Xylella fastidiosa TaxID=2371 RepID=B2I4N7_XYLF2|nr:chemotaxis protein CheB [Xylella fastidiosa]ADN63865.1 hypothetical protein XFLM_09930 [Xylella fastidiosa subsp. fastidiosa GB514]KAF0572010.1 glutamate methyltransferase [Xylella fastidiosa subsp. fastidiosa Mus-1]ACB92332.1 conserved hypothetical protein [Xylella fastidiosa M23]EGO81811.1 Chemotaxis response regulator [Xylella fastidiosa EB92.1]KGM21045.1 glutamate methyltransferase [Xylella fastidiosa]